MTPERPLLRVSIDSNVFVSSLISGKGPTYRVIQAIYRGDVALILSREQHAEILDVIQRPGLQHRLSASDVQTLRNTLAIVDLYDAATSPPVTVRDPKDENIVATAIAGQADFIITGDDDLLVLADEPAIAPLRIVTPRAFVDLFDPDE